jgi:hypothetical protein
MATVKYGDVVTANETLSLEDKLKRRRASSGEIQPQEDPSGSAEQTEPKNNEPKKRSA